MPQPSIRSPQAARTVKTPLQYRPLPSPPPARLDAGLPESFKKQDDAAKLAAKVKRHRSVVLTAATLTGGVMVTYAALLFITTTRDTKTTFSGPQTQSELTNVYDRTASGFDADVGLSEWLMGLLGIRASIASQCKGHVLEVSCGTARNLGYYRFGGKDGVKSLTLVDISQEMVEQGKLKWAALKSGKDLQGITKGVPVRFWRGDVKGRMPDPPMPEAGTIAAVADAGREGPKKGYDTIVQTLGLCSTDQPVELLQSISSHLDRSNPEAKVFLIEHGLGYYDWLNSILDKQAPMHADKHGCWWNRDIGEIVRRSGLEIVREKRRNLGTTWIYELRPDPKQIEPVRSMDTKQVEEPEAATGLAAWLPRWTYEKICRR